ncbi:MAG: AAA family ATPase [Sandaracinaceae bacterium]|nr:AAA family ATPase [Sandaracinaceae bacterium]
MDQLVILDEVHPQPGLFQELRGLIDQGRRRGTPPDAFIAPRSASMDLLRQSGKTLAGRINYLELGPLRWAGRCVPRDQSSGCGCARGFPRLSDRSSDARSARCGFDFIRTYLRRDVPNAGTAHRRGDPAPLLDDTLAPPRSPAACVGVRSGRWAWM